jgi:hypothetical protein
MTPGPNEGDDPDRLNQEFDEIHKRIGAISSSFAGLEEELINAFSLLVNDGNESIGRTVADKLSFSVVVELFEDLAEYCGDPKAVAESRAIGEKLRKVNKDRNNVIHSAWHVVEDRPHSYSPTPARSRGTQGSTILNAKDHLAVLDRLWGDICSIESELQSFVYNYLT